MKNILKEIKKISGSKFSLESLIKSSDIGVTTFISDNKLNIIVFHVNSNEKIEIINKLDNINDLDAINKLKAIVLSNLFNYDINSIIRHRYFQLKNINQKITICSDENKSELTIEQEKSEDNICRDKEQFKLYIQRAFIDGKISGLESKDTTAKEYYHDNFEKFDPSKIEELVTQAHAGDIEVISGVYNGREMTEEEIASLSQDFVYKYHYDSKF